MDFYDTLDSSGFTLNEQIARQVFESIVEDGPLMVIIDTEKNFWHSDSEKFSNLNIDRSVLTELCAKIDDGAEPVMTQLNDCSIISTQLSAEQTNCGYIFLILPQYSPESTLANIDLVEILLNQINLIAILIEKNHFLCKLQAQPHSKCASVQAILN